jgi:hypothetical protein
MEDALSSFHFLNTGSDRSHCPVPASTSRLAWLWYSLYGSGESHLRICVRSDTTSCQFVLRESYVNTHLQGYLVYPLGCRPFFEEVHPCLQVGVLALHGC